MPNFDRTGPRKRGRVIGRDLEHYKKCISGYECRTIPGGFPVKEETPPV